MAIHWQIKFVSLRSHTTYVLNVYDANYSGTPVQLKGGSEPFTTEEDADEDMFKPVRTQSGTFRVVDDGKDANGNTLSAANSLKAMLPNTDTDRPVQLTKKVGDTWVVLWMGYMQAQNFGSVLYGDPQEREFPVQCCLSVLNATQVSTTEGALHNFAYLLQTVLTTLPTNTFSSFVIQGGADARNWLLKKFDWNNFLTETEDSDAEPRYSHYQILEDMCQFWGWSCRTYKNVVYLTAMDDTAEQTLLTLTPTELGQLASESSSSAGTVSNVGSATALSGDIFASTDNDSFMNRGPNKATVKATVNENERVVSVLPPSVEKELDATGWTWHQVQGEDLVGWFQTQEKSSFDSPRLSGSNYSNYCKFQRRQVYSTKESDTAQICDMMTFKNLTTSSFPYISLQTKKAMAFAGGSIILSGTIYTGERITSWSELTLLRMRVGIGMTRNTARWWHMDQTPITQTSVDKGWSSQGTVREFYAGVSGGSIKSTALRYMTIAGPQVQYYDALPVPNEANLYGYLFIDFGEFSSNGEDAESFEIADFSVKFSRDTIVLPTTVGEVRGREKIEERVNMKEYKSDNQNSTGVEWNADCIFASDNNMTYGYGLLMNANGTFMETVGYGNSSEHPEQHLANRVTAYWTRSRRSLKVDLRANAVPEITPVKKVTLDGTTGQPVAISNDWRNDTTTVTIMELP